MNKVRRRLHTIRSRNWQFKCLKTLKCAYETWPYSNLIIRFLSDLLTFRDILQRRYLILHVLYGLCIFEYIIVCLFNGFSGVSEDSFAKEDFCVVLCIVWFVSFCVLCVCLCVCV